MSALHVTYSGRVGGLTLVDLKSALTDRFVPYKARAWGTGMYLSVALCPWEDSNLVDSASSHTLVSKIKPCMSKYKSFTLKLRTAHYISYSLFDSPLLLG